MKNYKFQVYVLSKGDCLYQGATQKLVPYLTSIKLPCPMYHNPADYSTYDLKIIIINRNSHMFQTGHLKIVEINFQFK